MPLPPPPCPATAASRRSRLRHAASRIHPGQSQILRPQNGFEAEKRDTHIHARTTHQQQQSSSSSSRGLAGGTSQRLAAAWVDLPRGQRPAAVATNQYNSSSSSRPPRGLVPHVGSGRQPRWPPGHPVQRQQRSPPSRRNHYVPRTRSSCSRPAHLHQETAGRSSWEPLPTVALMTDTTAAPPGHHRGASRGSHGGLVIQHSAHTQSHSSQQTHGTAGGRRGIPPLWVQGGRSRVDRRLPRAWLVVLC